MPGPKILDPAPEWVKNLRPENASVLDPAWKAPARTLVSLLGLDDPQSQVLGLAAGIETKEAQTLLERFPRLAKVLKSVGTVESAEHEADVFVSGQPFNLDDPVHKAVSMVDEFGSQAAAISAAKARLARDPGDTLYRNVLRRLEYDSRLPTLEYRSPVVMVSGQPFNLDDPIHKAASMVDEFGSQSAAITQAKARLARDPGDTLYRDVLRRLEYDSKLPKLEYR